MLAVFPAIDVCRFKGGGMVGWWDGGMTAEGQWILNGVTAAAFQEGQARIQYNWLGALWLPRLWLPRYPTFEKKT